jgi:hypothetical protein
VEGVHLILHTLNAFTTYLLHCVIPFQQVLKSFIYNVSDRPIVENPRLHFGKLNECKTAKAHSLTYTSYSLHSTKHSQLGLLLSSLLQNKGCFQ